MTKIHPLWLLCILVRIFIIIIIRNFNKKYYNYLAGILFLMGSGFIFKGFSGSNMEKQVAKVFWHETRYLHGLLYVLSAYFVFIKNIKMASLVLLLDIIFSLMYRFNLFF
jgi:hypothetical protein